MKSKKAKTIFNPAIMHKDYYPFLERIFYRRISSPLTSAVAKMGFSPTAINFIGFFVGSAGIYLIAVGDYLQRVVGALILVISYIFDCVDGQLARGLKKSNKFGALLDTTLDSTKESLVFFALAWNYYYFYHHKYIFLYLAAVLFLQRMFGRTLPWYHLVYGQDVEEIKKTTVKNMPPVLRFIAYLFSESYRSGTIWMVIFLGVVLDQAIATFIYFIFVLLALFFSLLFNAYQQRNTN